MTGFHTCVHGHRGEDYCPDCAELVKRAAERIAANGGISTRRLRVREERLERERRAS